MTHSYTWTQSRVNPLRFAALPILDTPLEYNRTWQDYKVEVDTWMLENDCGHWMHSYMVQFETEKEAFAFMLRWS